MSQEVNCAFVTPEYQEKCPKCGMDMQQVPYFSGVLVKLGQRREAASLSRDRIFQSYSIDDIRPCIGGYCPHCTQATMDRVNQSDLERRVGILEEDRAAHAKWEALTEKQRKSRRCPAGTVIFFLFTALTIVLLCCWLFGTMERSTALTLMVCTALIGGIAGFMMLFVAEGGLFPLRYPEPKGTVFRDLYDISRITQEELADKIVKERNKFPDSDIRGPRMWYTPETLRKL